MRIGRRTSIVAAVGVLALVAGCTNNGDDASTDTTSATTAAATTTTVASSGVDLSFAVLRPTAGLLSELGLGQRLGIDLAMQDVQAAGGKLAVTDVTPPQGSAAVDVVDQAVKAGPDGVIGPVGSDEAEAALPALAKAGATTCVASATAVDLGRDAPDKYLRTALGDDVTVSHLATVLGERLKTAGGGKVLVVARGDDFGASVGNGLANTLVSQGVDAAVLGYNPNTVMFDEVTTQVKAANAKLIVLVTYEEGPRLLGSLVKAGVPATSLVGLDAFFIPRLASIAGVDQPELVEGFTAMGTTGDRAFVQRVLAADPNGRLAYAAQGYDCAITLTLAGEAAKMKGTSLFEAVRSVTSSGAVCSTYADCATRLRAGEDIDYDGPSGRLEIDARGEPGSGRFTEAAVKNGELGEVTSTDVDIAELGQLNAAFLAASFTTRLQQSLTLLGFYSGPINGIWSDELSKAIADFQTSVGLPPTGVYDAATDAALRAKLGSFASVLSTSTTDLQVALTQLGFYSGPIDGVYSAELVASVKALQRSLGVPETGVLDVATTKAIFEQGVQVGTPPSTVAPPPTEAPTTAAPTTVPEAQITTLFELVASKPELSTFRDVLVAAGFDGTAESIVPITLFAPTNDAFAKLPAGTLDALLMDPVKLRELLAYHGLLGVFPSARLTSGPVITIHGAPITVTVDAGTVTVNEAKVVLADQVATNGVLHEIDSVLTPPAG